MTAMMSRCSAILGTNAPDAATERFKGLADRWTTTIGMSDDALADGIRNDGIDILVDLAGHTAGNRLPVFARKPAPVQVTWLGYPNTTGLAAIDCRLVDAVTDPEGEADAFASETLVRLPEGFLCYGARDDAPAPATAPCVATGFVTFGSFNNPAKLSGATLDVWAQLLARLPTARLLLKGKPFAEAATRAIYLDRLVARGVAADRIELVGWLPEREHLALHDRVDIALDPFPYNGTTTTCEALWMGVPAVTLRGDRHAGRVGASLLTRIGLSDLIAESVEGYVEFGSGAAERHRVALRIAPIAAAAHGGLAAVRCACLRPQCGSRLPHDVAALVRGAHATAGHSRSRAESRPMNRHQRRAAAKQGQSPRNPAKPAANAAPDVAKLLTAGVAHHRAGRLREAETCYRQVLAVEADHAEALHLMGVIAHQIGRHDVAVELIGRAIERNDKSPSYFCNLADALRGLGRLEEAAAACRYAIHVQPAFAEAYSNLGLALKGQGKLDEAVAACRDAIRLKPTLAVAHYNLGNALRESGQVEEAMAAYRQALRIEPSSAQAHYNLATGFVERGNCDEAVAAFREAIRLKPDFVDAGSSLLLSMSYSEDFSPAAFFEAHRAWNERHGRPPATAHSNDRTAGRRLKVGYVSPDFRQHSVAHFLEPLLRSHDRNEIEVFCYSGVSWPDEATGRFEQLADHWFTTVGMPDEALAHGMRQHGIDILVDLAGHTAGNRLPVFARKPAPVQVTWLGYPNTTGLAAIDYRLVDAVTDPEGEADAFASETLVRLPEGFLCYGARDDAPAPATAPCVRNRLRHLRIVQQPRQAVGRDT